MNVILSMIYCLHIAASLPHNLPQRQILAELNGSDEHLQNTLLNEIGNWDDSDILFAMGVNEPEYDDLVNDEVIYTVIIHSHQ